MLTRKQHELLSFLDRRLAMDGICPSFEEMKEALGLRSKSGIHRLISGLEERGFIRRLPHRARALEILRRADGTTPPTASSSTIDHGRSVGVGPDARAGRADPLIDAALPTRTGQDQAATGQAASGQSPNVIEGGFPYHGPSPRESRTHPAEMGEEEIPLYGKIAAGTPIEALRDPEERIAVPPSMLGRGRHYALRIEGDSMIDAGILDGDIALIRETRDAESGQIVVALVDEHEATLKRLRRKGKSIALEPANPAHETRIFGPDRVRVQGILCGLLRRYD